MQHIYQILVSSSFLAIGVTVLYIQKPVLPILIGIRCYFSTNITYCSSIGNFLCFFFQTKYNIVHQETQNWVMLCLLYYILSHSFWGFPYKVKIKMEKYIETISVYMYNSLSAIQFTGSADILLYHRNIINFIALNMPSY